MNEFNVELQGTILSSYVASIEKAIERSDTFVNAVDLEIMNIAKNILTDRVNYTITERAFNILEDRTEQDIIYTPKHIEVCKAIKRVYFSLVSENESAREVSCTTEFNEQTTNNYDVLDSIDEILKELSGKLIANKKLGKDE